MKKIMVLLLLTVAVVAQRPTSPYAQGILWRDLHKSTQDSIRRAVADSLAALSADGVTITQSGSTFQQKVFANVAALEVATGSDGQVAVLDGSSWMQLDSALSETGNIIATNNGTSGKQWVRKAYLDNPNVVNIAWAQEMAANDSAAFKNLFSAFSNSSITLEIPAGNYDLSTATLDTIRAAWTIKGEGVAATVITGSTSKTFINTKKSILVDGLTLKDFQYAVKFQHVGLSGGENNASVVFENMAVKNCLYGFYGVHNTNQTGDIKLKKVRLSNVIMDSTFLPFRIAAIIVDEVEIVDSKFENIVWQNSDTWLQDTEILTAIQVGNSSEGDFGGKSWYTKTYLSNVTIKNIDNYRSGRIMSVLSYRQALKVVDCNFENMYAHKTVSGLKAAIALAPRSSVRFSLNNSDFINCSGQIGAISFKAGKVDSAYYEITDNYFYNYPEYNDSLANEMGINTTHAVFTEDVGYIDLYLRDNRFFNIARPMYLKNAKGHYLTFENNTVRGAGYGVLILTGDFKRIKHTSNNYEVSAIGFSVTPLDSFYSREYYFSDDVITITDTTGSGFYGYEVNVVPKIIEFDNCSVVSTKEVQATGTGGFRSMVRVGNADRTIKSNYKDKVGWKPKLIVKNCTATTMYYNSTAGRAVDIYGSWSDVFINGNKFLWGDRAVVADTITNYFEYTDNTALNLNRAGGSVSADPVHIDSVASYYFADNRGSQTETDEMGTFSIAATKDSVNVTTTILELEQGGINNATDKYIVLTPTTSMSDSIAVYPKGIQANRFTVKSTKPIPAGQTYTGNYYIRTLRD